MDTSVVSVIITFKDGTIPTAVFANGRGEKGEKVGNFLVLCS